MLIENPYYMLKSQWIHGQHYNTSACVQSVKHYQYQSFQVLLFFGLSTLYNPELAPKYDFQPSTMKPVKKHPPTIKTGQLWSSAGFKSGFLFSGGAEILNYFFEHLNVLK